MPVLLPRHPCSLVLFSNTPGQYSQTRSVEGNRHDANTQLPRRTSNGSVPIHDGHGEFHGRGAVTYIILYGRCTVCIQAVCHDTYCTSTVHQAVPFHKPGRRGNRGERLREVANHVPSSMQIARVILLIRCSSQFLHPVHELCIYIYIYIHIYVYVLYGRRSAGRGNPIRRLCSTAIYSSSMRDRHARLAYIHALQSRPLIVITYLPSINNDTRTAAISAGRSRMF
jgi:hypothetical protein